MVSIHVICLIRVRGLIPIIRIVIPYIQAIVHIIVRWRWEFSNGFISIHICILGLPIWVHTVISSTDILQIYIRIIFLLLIVVISSKSTQIVNSTFCVNIFSSVLGSNSPASPRVWLLLIIPIEIKPVFYRRWLVPVQIITVIHCVCRWLLYIVPDVHTIIGVLPLLSEIVCVFEHNGLVGLVGFCVFAIVEAVPDCCCSHLVKTKWLKAQYFLFVNTKYLVYLTGQWSIFWMAKHYINKVVKQLWILLLHHL